MSQLARLIFHPGAARVLDSALRLRAADARRGLLSWAALVVTVSLLFSPSVALAGAPVDVANKPAVLDVELEYFVDEQGQMSPAEVARASFFARSPNFGFTQATIWARFSLRNSGSEPLDLVLDATREWVAEVDLFVLEDSGPMRLFTSGTSVPVAKRPIPVERMVFPILLQAGETRQYMLRARSPSPLELRAAIEPRALFMAEHETSTLIFGGYYAILIGVGSYSLILFASLRDKLQAGVGFVLLSYALTELSGHGHLQRMLPAAAGLEMVGVGAGIVGVCLAIPYVVGLALPAGARRMSSALAFCGAAGAAICLLGTVVPRWTYLGLVGFALSSGASAVGCSYAVRTSKSAIYLSLALGSFLVPFVAITSGTLSGLLPAIHLSEYANHAGAVAMSLLFSLLVADSIRAGHRRVHALQVATDSLNSELSSQLDALGKRTHEVDSLNQELRFQVAARSRELGHALARANPSSTPLSPGDIVDDRYRVGDVLGSGGMGTVYGAERLSDGRKLALKVVQSTSGSDLTRFGQEARIAASLDHDNLVSIVDVGVSHGVAYLVMELVTGGSLEDHRARFGDRPWALALLAQMANALAALHEQGIVHRDLKPANILLALRDDRMTVKVTDFGIARQAAGSEANTAARLTASGALVGTLPYMAPEALQGSRLIGAPADVFAFGLMAFELVTGRSAFDVPPVLTPATLPAPHALPTELAPEIAAVLLACLALEPARRPVARALVEVFLPPTQPSGT